MSVCSILLDIIIDMVIKLLLLLYFECEDIFLLVYAWQTFHVTYFPWTPLFFLVVEQTVPHLQCVSGSNLGPDTGYPEFLRGFPQFLQANAGIVP
jgi:hypothetical protein